MPLHFYAFHLLFTLHSWRHLHTSEDNCIHLVHHEDIRIHQTHYEDTRICLHLHINYCTIHSPEYNCAYPNSWAVFKQVNLHYFVNVTSKIECANNLIYFHNLFHLVCITLMFVMLSPASIIYDNLSKVAQLTILSVIVIVCQWMIAVAGSVAQRWLICSPHAVIILGKWLSMIPEAIF